MLPVLDRPILVIGDVMLDHYIYGKVYRISPEAPVPVVNVQSEAYTLGGSANVAHNLASIGVPVELFGIVGNDVAAEKVESMSQSKGISTRFLKLDRPTTLKTRVLGDKQQIVRIDFEKKFEEDTLASDYLTEVLKDKKYSAVVISDYGKGVCGSKVCGDAIAYAKQEEIPVIVDPKGVHWQKYAGATIVTPNLLEFGALVNSDIPNQDAPIEKRAPQILYQYDIANLIITRSEKGISWVHQKGTSHYPTRKVDVFDVSGAGDTVVATFAYLLAARVAMVKIIQTANKAGGIVVSKTGTYAIKREEFEQAFMAEE